MHPLSFVKVTTFQSDKLGRYAPHRNPNECLTMPSNFNRPSRRSDTHAPYSSFAANTGQGPGSGEAAISAAHPGAAQHAAPDLQHTLLPLSQKAKRTAVKKIASQYQKLHAARSGATYGSGLGLPQTSYIEALTEAETKLAQLIATGLSTELPGSSASRKTKNALALAAGAATKTAQIGTASAAVLGCGAAVIVATPFSLLRGARDGVLGVLAWEPEEVVESVFTAIRPAYSTYKFVRGREEPWASDHQRVANFFEKINRLPDARAYAARPRLPTAEIAANLAAEISNELSQLYLSPAVDAEANPGPAWSAHEVEYPIFTLPADPPPHNTREPEARAGFAHATFDPPATAANRPRVHNWRFDHCTGDAEAFNVFQRRISQTSEYRNAASRPGLVHRVDTIVEAMRASPALQATCFAIASGYANACGDRIADELNDMEQAHISDKAATGQLSVMELFQTGMGFFKKQVLDEIAIEKIERFRRQGARIDEIEIRLAYPTELRDRLGLPGVTRSMLYRASAKVTDRDINAAETTVNARVRRGEAVPYIAAWEPWRASLERTNRPAYDRLAAQIQRDRDDLLETTESMNSRQAVDAFARQEEKEKILHRTLASQLTQQFIATYRPVFA